MKKYTYYILASFILLLAVSCTKVIDLKLGNNSGELVIEGNITNLHGPQTITLSRNVPVTNTNTYPPVTGAAVSVTDANGNNYPFIESPSGTYTVAHLPGVPGNTYTMNVNADGKTYSAVSTMPHLVRLDSITSVKSTFNSSKNIRDMNVHFQDPAGIANQYRFILYINNVQVKHIFAYDDQFIDGKYVNLELIESETDIHPGDTATIEMQCVDKPVYTYWYTLMQQQDNGPGGGITPSNPPTNITPVTLGYFSAHTTQRKTVVVE